MRRPFSIALGLALTGVLAPGGGAEASPSVRDGIERAAAYLVSRQQPNGAFFSSEVPADGVAEVIASLAVAGRRGEPVGRALSYLRERGRSRADTGAHTGRIVMGIVAAGEDPRRFGGFDYVARLGSFYAEESGAYDTATVYADALAILGVVAAGERTPAKAVAYLRNNRCPGGGFSWRASCVGVPDVDTTAAVIDALIAAGVPRADSALTEARDFLARSENLDGGFGLDATTPETNANSTALALTALAALGEDPHRAPWLQSDGDNPLDILLALQHSSGGFRFRAAEAKPNDYATVQAIPGIAGLALPIRPAAKTAPSARTGPKGPTAPTATDAGAPATPQSAISGGPRHPSAAAAGGPAAQSPSSVLALEARLDERKAEGFPGLAWVATSALAASAGLLGGRIVTRSRRGRRAA